MSRLRLPFARINLDVNSIGLIFLVFGAGIVVGGYLTSITPPERNLLTFIKEIYSNLGVEMLSIAATVIVIDRLNRRREEHYELRKEQEQLVRDARSSVNEVARNAVFQLRKRDWLAGENGVLKGVDLHGADLQGANLGAANLQGANLGGANLQGARLMNTSLQDARLIGAILRGAKLSAAHLQGADLSAAHLQVAELSAAHLQGAILWGANLQGAILMNASLQDADLEDASLLSAILMNASLQDARLIGANLQGANMNWVELNETTILPDGTKWTPDTKMTRFTSPRHPNFWRSDNRGSPAYRGAAPAPSGSPEAE